MNNAIKIVLKVFFLYSLLVRSVHMIHIKAINSAKIYSS